MERLGVTKIISGGQNGADIAGLKFAKWIGLKTGGWIPNGFRTIDGNKPEYAELYNLKETIPRYYPPRTAMNVKSSDATIWFASNWSSGGEILTKNMCIRYNKPYFDVCVNTFQDLGIPVTPPWELAAWLTEHNVKVLNIAGNSEQTSPGIEAVVFQWLKDAFNEQEMGN